MIHGLWQLRADRGRPSAQSEAQSETGALPPPAASADSSNLGCFGRALPTRADAFLGRLAPSHAPLRALALVSCVATILGLSLPAVRFGMVDAVYPDAIASTVQSWSVLSLAIHFGTVSDYTPLIPTLLSLFFYLFVVGVPLILSVAFALAAFFPTGAAGRLALRAANALGAWAMLDVFVVALFALTPKFAELVTELSVAVLGCESGETKTEAVSELLAASWLCLLAVLAGWAAQLIVARRLADAEARGDGGDQKATVQQKAAEAAQKATAEASGQASASRVAANRQPADGGPALISA